MRGDTENMQHKKPQNLRLEQCDDNLYKNPHCIKQTIVESTDVCEVSRSRKVSKSVEKFFPTIFL